MARTLLSILGGLLALMIFSACGREPVTPNPTGTLGLTPQGTQSMTYEAPRSSETYADEPSETLELQPLKPNGEPEEDDPRWDSEKHGNKQSGETVVKPQKPLSAPQVAEDGSVVPEGFYDRMAPRPTQLPTEHTGGIELPAEVSCVVNGEKITPASPSWPEGCPGA